MQKKEVTDFWRTVELLSSHLDDITHRGVVVGQKIFILNYINSRGRCNMKDIVKNLHLPPSTATRQIDSLVKSKFVKRVIPDHNRRSVELTLDEYGIELSEWLVDHLNRVLTIVKKNYTSDELNISLNILREIAGESDRLLLKEGKKR